MKIKVLYLGGSRLQTGSYEELLELPEHATIAQVRALISQLHPKLEPLLGSVRFSLNFEFASLEDTLHEGDEVGLLPPVQGGAPRVLCTKKPIDPEIVRSWVHNHQAGATTSFVGTVRDHSRGKSVLRLEYEAYVPMVERQLERICSQCEQGSSGTQVAIAHRYGTLQIGEISVIIAASSPHREAAFEACRKAIELIKVDVPIWKNEITTSGEIWVGWGGG